MNVERRSITLMTDASGDATGTIEDVNGLLSQIRYDKDDYADTVDFTITCAETGETLWAESNVTADATRAPRQATHGTDGAAALYAAGGAAVNDLIAISGTINIVVAQGGDSKSGTFHFVTV